MPRRGGRTAPLSMLLLLTAARLDNLFLVLSVNSRRFSLSFPLIWLKMRMGMRCLFELSFNALSLFKMTHIPIRSVFALLFNRTMILGLFKAILMKWSLLLPLLRNMLPSRLPILPVRNRSRPNLRHCRGRVSGPQLLLVLSLSGFSSHFSCGSAATGLWEGLWGVVRPVVRQDTGNLEKMIRKVWGINSLQMCRNMVWTLNTKSLHNTFDGGLVDVGLALDRASVFPHCFLSTV